MRPEPDNVRSLAAWSLDRILSSRSSADGPLRRAGRSIDTRDGRLLRELVLGSLRWLRRLDSVIEAAAHRRLEAIDVDLLAPLRIGVFQLLYLDRVPAHAAVDQAVREARRRTHRGGAGFTNAVLRRVAERPTLEDWPVRASDARRRLAIETSHPDLLVERWWSHFGAARAERMLRVNNRRKPPQILTFAQHGGRQRTAASLADSGVSTTPSSLAPQGLVVVEGDPAASPDYAEGTIYLQDVASQAAALVPPPSRDERILDTAAAPGGKSFSLLSYEPTVQVVAADVEIARLQILLAHRDRLGLPLPVVVADALRSPLAAEFERVVLVLPCTGTGTLRKNPELKWRFSETEIDRLADQGLAWVRSASHHVSPRGLICLVTCSLEPEENVGVARRFLERDAGFELLPLADLLPDSAHGCIVESGGWQVPPQDVHDGFTVHVLRRRPAGHAKQGGGSAGSADVAVACRQTLR